jgi:hypothetical protein
MIVVPFHATFILMTFGDGFEQSDDPPRPAGLPDAASSSATLWNHRESQLVDAREAERVVFQLWQDFPPRGSVLPGR